MIVVCWCQCNRFFFFKQKTAYELRISDWSSDVCSSDLFVYSVNYAAAFVVMYIFHFSLATKQPAVTAHRFARSIEEAGASKRVEALAEIVVRTFRSQFVALVGNLLIVVPVALLIADLMFAQIGRAHV